jgi:glycosyltransferase involved in cell wall biosynthesis
LVTDHNVWHGYVPMTRWFDRLTSSLDDRRITVSQSVLASLPRAIQRRSGVMIQGIDADDIRAQRVHRDDVRAELGIDPDALVVGTIANLRPQKAYPDLLAAAREVVDRLPHVQFVAVGQGPLEAEIRALHARLRLGDRLLLLGHRPDAVRVMSACDVFVLASHWEGSSVAVMEALALGLPVVATEVGGIHEVIEPDREGILVPPKQPSKLAAALVELLTDDQRRRRMAAEAAKRGEELSIEAAVRRTEALYRQLVAP